MSQIYAGDVSENEFVDTSVIEAFVPNVADLNIKEEIEAWKGQGKEESSSLLPIIEQRQFLLLDELVPVGVVLRINAALNDAQLHDIVSRLQVKLEARVIGSPAARQSDSTNPTQISEVLQTLYTKDLGTPIICQRENGDEDDHDYVYVCWKNTVKLTRPKAKLLKLGVYFVASATLGPAQHSAPQAYDEEYLPSLEYLAPNVLQAFTAIPKHATADLQIRAPGSQVQDLGTEVNTKPKSIKSGSRQLFRTAPALLWRLKFLTLPDSPRRDETIVALDFEITTFAEASVRVDDVQLTPTIGSADSLGPSLPMTCMAGDQATLIYRLAPDEDSLPRLSKDDVSQEVQIVAQATVLISDVCQPKISITWKTTVETPNARPLSGSRPILHASRPGTADPRESGDLTKTFDPDALTMTDRPGNVQSSATVASGISLTVSGPPEIEVGRQFEWTVLVDNRSEKSQRLAIVTIPRRNLPQSSHKSEKSIRQHSVPGSEQQAGLVCLTPDVRIEPLAAAASHEAVIKFLPLDPGVAHLDAFRLVDMTNQNAIDILNVPDIIISKG